jgi:hypothetical protein
LSAPSPGSVVDRRLATDWECLNSKGKPGTVSVGTNAAATAEQAEGAARRSGLLETLAARIAAGTIDETIGGELGLPERATPPFGFQRVDGRIRFQLAPHFSIRVDVEADETGDRRWQISF